MATNDKSFLEQRVAERIAEKKEQRASNTEAYVQGLSNSSSNAMSPSSSIPKSGKELRARAIENPENTKAIGKVAIATAMGEAGSKSRGLKRERDEKGRFVATTRATEITNTSLKTLKAVFKDQTEKIIRTLNANNAAQMKVLSKLSGPGGKPGADDGIFDLVGDLLGGTDKGRGKGRGRGASEAGRGGGRLGRVLGAGKGFLSRGASMFGTAFSALSGIGSRTLEAGGGALSKMPGAGRTALGAVKSGLSGASSAGARALSTSKIYGGKAMSALGDLGPGVRSIAQSPLAGKLAGGGSKILGAAAAPALAGYEAYSAVTDDTKTAGAKAQAVADAAGGLGGSLVGGELGGAIGTAIFPGIGTLVGGALGGVAGYFAGEKFVNSIGTSITGAVEDSGVGEVLGKGMAVVMSPFSEDARMALKKDWATNMDSMSEAIAPVAAAAASLTEKLKDYTEATFKAGGEIAAGAKAAASVLWSGVKSASTQVAAGYNAGGVKGAVDAVPAAVSKVTTSAGAAGAAIKAGVSNAGSTMAYVKEKGSSSALDLAMGFSASKGITGLSDSQTKAYAGNVMKTESGGKLGITNQYGFAGQYQFGADALSDNGLIDRDKLTAAKSAAGKSWYSGGGHKAFMEDNSNWKNAGGRDAFLTDKKLQDDTFSSYTNKNISGGYRKNKAGKSALDANSTPEDIAAYAKAAHLKGVGGADALIRDGVDSTDANGTKASKYARDGATAMDGLAAQVDAKKVALGLPALGSPSSSAVTTRTAQADAVLNGGRGVTDPNDPRLVRPGSVSPPSAVSTSFASNTAGGPYKTTPTASATPVPSSLVSPNTPQETQSVSVSNLPAPAQVASNTGGGNSVGRGANSSQPGLDEVPMHITDFGLVLLNIGHV